MFVFLHKDDTSISPSGGPSSSSTNNTHTRFLITWAAAFQWLYYIGSVPSNIYLQLLLMLCCSAQRGRINGRVCVTTCAVSHHVGDINHVQMQIGPLDLIITIRQRALPSARTEFLVPFLQLVPFALLQAWPDHRHCVLEILVSQRSQLKI